MRISDWSSDVCSSDLIGYVVHQDKVAATGLDCKHGRAFTLADTRRPERLRPWPRPVHGIDRAANTAQRVRNFTSRSAKPRYGGLNRSMRSEEHTSELQSLMRTSYAVFSLKKKNTT